MTITADVTIDDPAWRGLERAEQLVQGAITAAASAAGLREDGTIDVLLTSDAAVARLNRTWRGKDKTTNVLSFAAPAMAHGPAGGERPLGDIAIAAGCVRREAEAQHKPMAMHLCHLAIHGTLHLLGYSHDNDTEADRMERLETQAMAALGLGDPYAETAGAAGE